MFCRPMVCAALFWLHCYCPVIFHSYSYLLIRRHYDTKHASTFSQFKEKQRSDKFESLNTYDLSKYTFNFSMLLICWTRHLLLITTIGTVYPLTFSTIHKYITKII
jgi:hypothetical protein